MPLSGYVDVVSNDTCWDPKTERYQWYFLDPFNKDLLVYKSIAG